MNNFDNIPLVEMSVHVEMVLESKLAACLLLYPKETLALCNGLKFRANMNAKRLWDQVQKIKDEILDSDDEYKLLANLIIDLRIPLKDQYKWFALILKEDLLTDQPINPADRIIKALSDLEATRGTAVWLDYVQKNHILDDAFRGV